MPQLIRANVRGLTTVTRISGLHQNMRTMDIIDFNLKVAKYAFCCPVCGTMIRKGDNYIEENGVATCLCRMPAQTPHTVKAASDFEEALRIAARKNLKLRLEIEILTMHPEGKAARSIRQKYERIREDIRAEKEKCNVEG